MHLQCRSCDLELVEGLLHPKLRNTMERKKDLVGNEYLEVDVKAKRGALSGICEFIKKWKVRAFIRKMWLSQAVRVIVAPSSLIVFVQGTWKEVPVDMSQLV